MQYALDKLQQIFMKTQLGMSVCLIKNPNRHQRITWWCYL